MNFDNIGIEDIAVQAVIKNDKTILIEALKQLSGRVQYYDPNDIITDLAIIHHTAKKFNENPDTFLLTHSEGCEEELINEIHQFVKRAPEEKTIEIMGYKEVYTPEFKYVFSFL
jgi:hypothetical protein